jgi:hypothetical protein
VVLYVCKNWSLILREEHEVRVIENWVLRRILGPKRDVVRIGWRELHNEEHNKLHSSPSITSMIKSRRWAGNIA